MSSKSIPISARISQEDAEFLGRLEIEGARTPSDKLRAILADARQWYGRSGDFGAGLQRVQGQLTPLLGQLRQAEFEAGIHSELLARLLHWLPEMLAFVAAADLSEGGHAALTEFERGAAERIFRLIESVLQLGVTQRNPCYDPNVVSDHMMPVLELAQAIAGLRGHQ